MLPPSLLPSSKKKKNGRSNKLPIFKKYSIKYLWPIFSKWTNSYY